LIRIDRKLIKAIISKDVAVIKYIKLEWIRKYAR
jgi:hypothetical protein